MRLRNTWRRAGVRSSRSSQTTPTPTRPHIAEAASSSGTPDLVSAAGSSPTVQSPSASTTASGSCSSLSAPGVALGRDAAASYLETLVKCTPLNEPSEPANAIPDDPGGTVANSQTSLADSVRGVANILRALDAVGESVPGAEATPTPAREQTASTDHADGELDGGRSTTQVVGAEDDDGGHVCPEHAAAEHVHPEAIVTGLAGPGEPAAASAQGLQPAAATAAATAKATSLVDDSNLLMLALRQDGDHSVLLLTLLDKVAATDAKYDAEQLAGLVRDCKSNMASLASVLRTSKTNNSEHSDETVVEDAGEVASDCSLTRAATVLPPAGIDTTPKVAKASKTGERPLVAASAHRDEPGAAQGAVPKAGHSSTTTQPDAAPLVSSRVAKLGEALAKNLGDVVGDLRDHGEPRNEEAGSMPGVVGDLGDHPVNDKYRSVPPGPGQRGPLLSGTPGGAQGAVRGAVRGAQLEDAKRRVMFQSRPSELARVPRLTTKAQVSSRVRPRGCRMPSLLSQGPVVDGVAPHRANKIAFQYLFTKLKIGDPLVQAVQFDQVATTTIGNKDSYICQKILLEQFYINCKPHSQLNVIQFKSTFKTIESFE
ncbi:mucin-5AC-like [Thrips palmi]|uniref:Mucin-5AC-like n=1 Tax=Thrips palmi TaxID=161013 RepID=A0A6P8Z567_THRPL|nr:mucin-5AC-like [Thrips palmi]